MGFFFFVFSLDLSLSAAYTLAPTVSLQVSCLPACLCSHFFTKSLTNTRETLVLFSTAGTLQCTWEPSTTLYYPACFSFLFHWVPGLPAVIPLIDKATDPHLEIPVVLHQDCFFSQSPSVDQKPKWQCNTSVSKIRIKTCVKRSSVTSPPSTNLKEPKLHFLILYIWPTPYTSFSNKKITSTVFIKHLLCLFLLLNYFTHTPSTYTSFSLNHA